MGIQPANNGPVAAAPFWITWLLVPPLFIIFFVTKLFGYIDVPIIASLLIVMLGLRTAVAARIDESVQFFFVVLCLLSCYGLFISVLHGAQEVIFALKFLRTLLLFTLLYYVWMISQRYLSYERFLKYFSLLVFVHALIVLLCISVVEFREFVYSITGYTPRGPGWSRSPGLTVSFNTPSILHILGIWVLISRTHWSVIARVGMVAIILASLVFMGRTIAFLGLLMVFTYVILLSKRVLRSIIALSAVVVLAVVLGNDALLQALLTENLYSSLSHFLTPLRSIGAAGGVDSYFEQALGSHIYFSGDISTLLFGNSLAGHIGLIDPVGETMSDLGFVNSINANGILITAILYSFYVLMFWQTRHGDWRTVSFVVLLSLMLTFKETGFFTSHATPVMFFLYFYNRDAHQRQAAVSSMMKSQTA